MRRPHRLVAFTAVSASSLAIAVLVACSSSSDDGPSPQPAEAAAETSAPAVDAADALEPAKVCEPQPVVGFTPRFHAAAGKYRDKCTTAQLDAFFAACLPPTGNTADCAQAKLDSPACNDCMLGTLDSNPATAIVKYPTFLDRNIAACVGLFTGDTSATSCAAKTAASFQCGIAACEAGCKLTKLSDFDAFNECAAAANESAEHCKPYADAADACLKAAGAEVKSICLESIASMKIYVVMRHYGELFCGAPPSDAGADGGDGG